MNYKIKVNSEAESREVQGLFFELGATLGNGDRHAVLVPDIMGLAVIDGFINFVFNDVVFIDIKQCKEITLHQLRDIVVLKRNDVGDKNAWDGSRWDLYLTSDNKLYFHDGDVWKESKSSGKEDAHSKLKPIKKEGGMLSNKEALMALANGEGVQFDSHSTNEWFDLVIENFTVGEILSGEYDFRLKPKTILLNGIEVPAPFEPKKDDVFFYVDTRFALGYGSMHCAKNYKEYEQFGAWRTKSEITQVVAALRKVFGGV